MTAGLPAPPGLDGLTGLFNHRAFQQRFTEAVIDFECHAGIVHLALLDIDHFKAVNDTFGHLAGDAVLKRVIELMANSQGNRAVAARYGGEEFAILYERLHDKEAYDRLESLRKAIAAERFKELGGGGVTISIGLYLLRSGETKEQAFSKTDEGLYDAKRSGKNRTVIH